MTDDADLLARARARSKDRCAYCDVHAGGALELDFHRPLSHGGARDDENALCCCRYCKFYKSTYWHEVDAPNIPLLHPFKDAMGDHVRWLVDGALVGITAEGRFYIERLRLNRAPLLEQRRRMRDALTAAQPRLV